MYYGKVYLVLFFSFNAEDASYHINLKNGESIEIDQDTVISKHAKEKVKYTFIALQDDLKDIDGHTCS